MFYFLNLVEMYFIFSYFILECKLDKVVIL